MEKALNEKLIKNNLIMSSLFVTNFEMLKSSIQDRIKGFLCRNARFNKEGELEFEISEDYRAQVLEREIPKIDRHRYREYHLFCSSCLWLKENRIIDSKDYQDIQMIRKHRNLISHNPLKLLIDANTNVNKDLLKKSQKLLFQIERLWILNFEIPINPEYDGEKVEIDDIKSGKTIYLDYLINIVEGEIAGV